jgi:hypothetical protein
MSSSRRPCPFEFSPLPNNASIVRDFLGYEELGGLVRGDPGGWVLGGRYGQEWAGDIYNMELREDDVWVVSYPKSGMHHRAV